MAVGIRKWDRLAADELRALQERRLRWILTHRIAPFSPLYRRMFEASGIDPRSIRTREDLARIPFTSKQDLLVTDENPDGPRNVVLQPSAELIRQHLPLGEKLRLLGRGVAFGKRRLRERMFREFSPCSMIFTTGRSTGSIPFFLTPHDHQVMSVAGRRIVEVLGLQPERDRVLNLFPYSPHLAFWQVVFCGFSANILSLHTGGGRVMGAAKLIGVIERFRPSVIVGMPGYFYHLLRQAVEEKRDLAHVKTIALGGENVPAGFKAKVCELMAEVGSPEARVASVFGFTEARLCWTECVGARRTGFHTSPDLSLFEIIDPDTGHVLPEGQTGELVYTSLEGRGSMMLRYRTGDIVEGGMVTEACPGCGRTVPRIMSDIRRVSNVKSLDIGKVKGTLINLNALSEMLTEDKEIEEWQIEIRKRNNDPFETDEIILHCAVRGQEEVRAFQQRIQNRVHTLGEIHLNGIEIQPLQHMLDRIGMEELTKEERIVDRRRAPVGAGQGGT